MGSSSGAISAELFTIPLDEGYLVYAPLRKAAFIANAAVVNHIADLQEGVARLDDDQTRDLWDLLRRLEILDGGPEVLPLTTYSGAPKPTVLSLFLTTSCNLRCSYCYASAGETTGRPMSLEVAERGIDFVIGNALDLARGEVEVAYHGGGEPSLNWPTLTRSFEYARRRAEEVGLGLRAAMATNGVMADDKIDWIVEQLDGATVSFDGLPEVHDTHRKTVLGQGSSREVVHTIRRLDEAGFDYALRLTVTHDQIHRMEESVDYICSSFRPQRIQVEPAYKLGRWKDAPSAETQAFIDSFRAARVRAHGYGQEIQFSAARIGTLSNHFCAVTQDGFGLTADGHVSACYEVFKEELPWAETFIYGAYDKHRQAFTFDLPVLNNLREKTVDRHAFCQGCFAKWTCGGDCYHKSLAVNGHGAFSGSDRCHIVRELTKDLIVDRITSSGGFFWHEPPQEAVQTEGEEVLRQGSRSKPPGN